MPIDILEDFPIVVPTICPKEVEMNNVLEGVRPPIIILNDQHIPFDNKRVFDIQRKFIEWRKVKTIILAGDLADFYAISFFSKSPERVGDRAIRNEVEACRSYLRKLREIAPNARIVFIVGNHEFRLRKHIYIEMARDSSIYTILNLSHGVKHEEVLEKLFDLPELGIEIIDLKPDIAKFSDNYVVVGDNYIGHFNRVNKHSCYTAKNLVADKGVRVFQAHTHRLGAYFQTTLAGTIYGFEMGCSCSLDPVYTSKQNWQNGFTVIEGDYNLKNTTPFLVPIVNNQCRYGKKVFKA